MRRLRAATRALALGAALCAGEAEALTLLCLGMDRPFMLTITDATARFDYLGDGTFGFDPPLLGPPGRYQRHEIVTRRARYPVYLETRDCAGPAIVLPVAVEIAVPTSTGVQPYLGCCLLRD